MVLNWRNCGSKQRFLVLYLDILLKIYRVFPNSVHKLQDVVPRFWLVPGFETVSETVTEIKTVPEVYTVTEV